MKKLTFPLLLATAMVLGACSTNDDVAEQVITGDYRIEIGDASRSEAITRAGFSTAKTRLMVHYVSDNKNTANDPEVTETNPLYMSTIATAAVDGTNNESSYSAVYDGTNGENHELAYKRYWDHIHGKNSALAVYAIAVPNKTSITNTTNKVNFESGETNPWGKMVNKGQTTAISHNVTWVITPAQTNTTFADEDLTASNNIKKIDESNDHRLVFDNNKFQKAEGERKLEFKHVLSRLTIQIKKNTTITEALTVSKVKLLGFNNKGTYNVESGTYSNMSSTDMDIVGSATTKDAGYDAAYTGLVFPERTLGDANTDPVLTIVANGNSYNVSGKDVADAIKANTGGKGDASFTKFEAGKNYILQVTIGLTGVETIQAKLVQWTDVTGTLDNVSNARITLTMESEAGTTANMVNYNIYRAARTYPGDDLTNTAAIDAFEDKNFGTGYGDELSLDANATTTTWYWPNSITFYHFRTISPQGTELTTAENDYITISGGVQAAENDYIWGAPLEEKHDGEEHNAFTYDPTTNGYGSYIFKAIGATKSQINITQFHMMSNIEVELQSETEANGGVNLVGSKVYLVRYVAGGKLQIGNALIIPDEAIQAKTLIAAITSPAATATKANHNYRVVPQFVTRGNNAADKIGLLIVTADGNTYPLDDLSTIKEQGTDNYITRWYPGKSYKYTFKVMKKKIDLLQAKLVNWNTVTGTIPEDITLEN